MQIKQTFRIEKLGIKHFLFVNISNKYACINGMCNYSEIQHYMQINLNNISNKVEYFDYLSCEESNVFDEEI